MWSSIAVGSSAICIFLLLHKRLLSSVQWRATVTPLASIIGSGFLIVAPLFHSVLGKWALAGIALLSAIAYALGWSIRYNIIHAEPILRLDKHRGIARMEMMSRWSLGAAYAISVAFYISLFAAFTLDRLSIDDPLAGKLLTTALLIGITLVAWLRGTKGLEMIELLAVSIKLAIIVGVLVALAGYDIQSGTAWFEHEPVAALSGWETIAMIAGMLMVTQGFETARFMGSQYSAQQRVTAVKHSQWIAIALYLLFIGLTCPLFLTFPIQELNETTISFTLGQAIWVLPFLLLVAAIASQLSAALADTLGGGGLLKELLALSVSPKVYYVLIVAVAMVLVWTSNVFEIINLASKGFALYYLMQLFITFSVVMAQNNQGIKKMAMLAAISALSGVLIFVIGWSIPAPHS